ncbi:DUF3592 domain-containing protein [Acidaminobacterium chupaoyuni]
MKTYLAFFLLAAGVLLLAMAFFLRLYRKKSLGRCIELPAEVCEVVRRHGKNGRAMYQPVVKFEYNGETRRIAAGACTGWQRFQENEPVEITYDPRRETVVAGGGKGLSRAAKRLFLAGAVFVAAGAGLLLKEFLFV